MFTEGLKMYFQLIKIQGNVLQEVAKNGVTEKQCSLKHEFENNFSLQKTIYC